MKGPSGVEAVLLALICCPKCGGALEERPAALTCRPCKRSWPVEKGVPLLVNEAKLPQPAKPKRHR
ncbi:MAG: hypothetical protein ACI9VR_001257 [Cognaticolwellia sp.]|jgi:uncharacterized protein YbaR (Trm112 family)